jgi:predicted ATPase
VAGEDYAVGHTLNRVARLMSAGHGGQILLSGSAAELVKENLPLEVRLVDLGEHLLKGLSRPEQIFQVVVPDLSDDFPPLVTVTQPRHNLPAHLTSFIGRAKELELIGQKCESARLVTLTGAGGVGKTRLAAQFASQELERYPAGIWWVELAPITNPDLVPQAMANALEIRGEGSQMRIDNLVNFLQNKRLLVIFDNCEHLVEACAVLADQLLKACPDLHILATSREALGVEGEAVLQVPPLSSPGHTAQRKGQPLPPPEQLLQYEAVQLFVVRAQACQPAFELSEATAPAVSLICQRLDGIPLAIELAAARVAVLSVQQIADRLEDMFGLLTGGARTAIPRHQTLRAAIQWSYALLEPVEQLLFRRLAVFIGGFTLEAAEAVCSGSAAAGPPGANQSAEAIAAVEILDLLLRLVEKSLVVVDFQPDRPSRYHLLETIRQYAREMLLESGEVEALHQRHCQWFTSWLTAGIPKMMNAEIPGWLDQIDSDFDNLRAAIEWSYLAGTGQEAALRIGSALFRYWWMRGNLVEGLQWLTHGQALESQDTELILLRAMAFYITSWMNGDLGDQENCLASAQRSVALYRQAGEAGQPGLVLALANLAQVLFNIRPGEAFDPFLAEGEAVGRRLGLAGVWSLAMLLWVKGSVAYARAGYEEAQAISEESWALFLQTGDRWNAGPLVTLGLIAQAQKRYDAAQRYYEEALALYGEIKDRGGMLYALNNLTFLAVVLGKPQQAGRYFREQYKIWQAQGNRSKMIEFIKVGCFFYLSELLKYPPEQAADKLHLILSALAVAATLQPEEVSALNEATLEAWFLENARLWAVYNSQPFTEVESEAMRLGLRALLETLGETGFHAALMEGKRLTLDQAAARILDFPI